MKKANNQTDNRFCVGYETGIINEIKKNNKTLELLDSLQEIIESLAGTWSINKPMADKLIYKNKEGEEFNQYEFLDNLHHWIDINQDYLIRDSQSNYNALKKQKRVA